jgi:hypothetical protein
MHTVEPSPGTFTTAQLERLAVYRAAVSAGFYNDGAPVGEPLAEEQGESDVQRPSTRSVSMENARPPADG